jgi:hypothetical protein
VRAHAREAADPADGAFPLILFSPSVNPPLCYTALLQQLASHGYIAAGISHTYESRPEIDSRDRFGAWMSDQRAFRRAARWSSSDARAAQVERGGR